VEFCAVMPSATFACAVMSLAPFFVHPFQERNPLSQTPQGKRKHFLHMALQMVGENERQQQMVVAGFG
jgi:hypothetical protein